MLENNLFEALLDVIPFRAYAVDINTYEVKYANRIMRDSMFAPRATKCWEKIFGQKDRCSWCTTNQLKQNDDRKHYCEFFDEVEDKWFSSNDELVSWIDGVEVKYSILLDISEQKAVQGNLLQSHAKLANFTKHLKVTNKNLQITKLLLQKKSDELESINTNLEKIVEEQIIKLREKDQLLFFQQKQLSLNDMMSVIAHQWKQPLNELSINNIYLKEKNKNKSNNEVYIENDEIIAFLATTISAFQNFYKVTINNAFFIKEAIENTILILNSSIRKYQIDMLVNYKGSEKVVINGQRNVFSQVVLTILENAISIFLERDIENPRIEIKLKNYKNRIVVTIEDNAGGIEDKDLPHIFEQAKSFKKNQSSGLGLYIAKLVMNEKLQGDIDVENGKEGAIFTITLPNSTEE